MEIEYVGTLFIEGMAAFPEKGEEIKKDVIETAKDWTRRFIFETVSVE